MNPLLILLPSAALLGVAVCIAAATFKKYCDLSAAAIEYASSSEE